MSESVRAAQTLVWREFGVPGEVTLTKPIQFATLPGRRDSALWGEQEVSRCSASLG